MDNNRDITDTLFRYHRDGVSPTGDNRCTLSHIVVGDGILLLNLEKGMRSTPEHVGFQDDVLVFLAHSTGQFTVVHVCTFIDARQAGVSLHGGNQVGIAIEDGLGIVVVGNGTIAAWQELHDTSVTTLQVVADRLGRYVVHIVEHDLHTSRIGCRIVLPVELHLNVHPVRVLVTQILVFARRNSKAQQEHKAQSRYQRF